MTIKFTCLSKGGGYHFPPCHILEICGFRVLLDCPLDLSALTIFSPILSASKASTIDKESPICSNRSSPLDLEEPLAQKRQKVERPLDADDLIYAEPWYKTVRNLHLWNTSFIDVVLISSPMGMLGLPFLTRIKGFSAKIYMTEGTARIGQLMLEDLVSMHMEIRQLYGPEESCRWMKWEELKLLPSSLRDVALGKDGGDLGSWMPLYRNEENDGHDLAKSIHHVDDDMEEMQKLAFLSSRVIDSVKAGGSVRIPVSRLGIILHLLEHMSASLDLSDLKVPIYIISSVGEELLAFTNIIPEWLCKQRQEKPMAMKVLQCSFLSGIRLQKVQPLLNILQPKVLLPKDLRLINSSKSTTFSIFQYCPNETLCIPRSNDQSELEIADLAFHFDWRNLKGDISMTRLKGELVKKHGRQRLISGNV